MVSLCVFVRRFKDKALDEIKEALLIFGIQGPTPCIGGGLYTIGISNDPDVVKGRAGSLRC
jgi:hypothetical protein